MSKEAGYIVLLPWNEGSTTSILFEVVEPSKQSSRLQCSECLTNSYMFMALLC